MLLLFMPFILPDIVTVRSVVPVRGALGCRCPCRDSFFSSRRSYGAYALRYWSPPRSRSWASTHDNTHYVLGGFRGVFPTPSHWPLILFLNFIWANLLRIVNA